MGQQIGEAGSTGASTGGHLHFEVVPMGKGKVDPRPFLCGLTGVGASASDNPATASSQPGGSVSTAGIPNNNYPPMGSGPDGAVPVMAPATQASSMGSYDGKSLYEFLATESSRRFSNPQWYRDISDPKDALRNDPDPAVRATAESIPIVDVKNMIWREIIFMMSLRDFYQMEKHERGERIEGMLATDLADRVNDYSAKVLGTLRSQATSR